MKYLINIKILSLVISFICTLSVSSWERGSEAMTWPLNKKKKKPQQNMQGRKEEKRHCNVPRYTNRAPFLGTRAGSRIPSKWEDLFSFFFPFLQGWCPSHPFRCAPAARHRVWGSASPPLVLLWRRAGPETCPRAPWPGTGRVALWGWDIPGRCPQVAKTKPSR